MGEEETVVDKDGHFCSPVLWKENLEVPSSESERQARQRLNSLWHNKLRKNPELAEKYSQGFKEDAQKGYIRKLTAEEAAELRKKSYFFLAHFPVFHPDKPEKCRRVLDAKAKCGRNRGIAFNDMVHTGPNLLNNIPGVLIRFREGRVAVNADVKEMYSQIRVQKEDQNMQAMLWKEGPEQPEEVYVNQVHIFGAACSPAVANFCMKLIVKDEADERLKRLIERDVYMDDYFGSFQDVPEANQLSHKVKDAAARRGFMLLKWLSNMPGVLDGFEETLQSPVFKEIRDRAEETCVMSKALGIRWEVSKDYFQLGTRKEAATVATPAEFLSIVSSVYDILGFFTPFTIKGKMLLAQVWRTLGNWDQQMPLELINQCEEWVQEIQQVAEHCKVPRWYGFSIPCDVWLHASSDASDKAYGAVIHLAKGSQVALGAAKARVAPTRPQSIPRLELDGALMAFRLAKLFMKECDQVNISRVTVWIDSTAVLGWIGQPAKVYNTYVANRLGEIHTLMDSEEFQKRRVEVRYVPSKLNPADIVSRGAGAADLKEQWPQWIGADSWLGKPEEEWPRLKDPLPCELNLERRRTVPEVLMVSAVLPRSDLDPDDFNNIRDLLEADLEGQDVSVEDLQEAEQDWLKQSQAEDFQKELARVQLKGRGLEKNGALKGKIIFLDDNGLLREESRLQYADFLPWEQRNPVVLHGKSKVGRLIIRDCHKRINHLGAKSTKAEVQRRFSMVGLGEAVRREVTKCEVCRRERPFNVQQPAAPYHVNRFRVGKAPFSSTGVDMFGPFILKGGARNKCWGLLFMCMTVRAVHIELVKSQDTTAFLLALNRFISRRGAPETIYSDAGTNFTGGADKVEEIFRKHVDAELASRWKTRFHTNPPGSPHWGGSWERMIAEVKKCMAAVGASTPRALSYEAMLTVMTQIEASLNQRPIALDDNGSAITPNHILGGMQSGQVAVPLAWSSLKMARLAGEMVNNFWKRWNAFYLPSLRADRNTKGKGRTVQLQPGDRVLVDESGGNAFIDTWVPGVVVKAVPSADGRVRSAEVQTNKGIVRRGLNRLAVSEEAVWGR